MMPVFIFCTVMVPLSGLQDDFHEAGFVVVEAFEPGGAIFQRGGGGDEGFDVDFAAGHHVEADGVFAGGGAGAEEGDFAGDDGLEWELDMWRGVADEDDGAAFADGGEGGFDRGVGADGFEGDVGAAVVGEFEEGGEKVWVVGVEGVGCAGFAGFVEAGVVDVEDDEVGAAGDAGDLGDELSDHAGADDDDGFSEEGGGAADGVDGDGDGFNHGGVIEGEVGGEFVGDVLGDGDEFGEAAVLAVIKAGDAEDAAVVAEVDVAGAAEGASAAVDGGVEGDAVAGGEMCDGVADGFDDASGFVSHDDGRDASACGAVVAVDVAAADAAGFDADEEVVGTEGGRGHVGDLECAFVGEEEGFHGVPSCVAGEDMLLGRVTGFRSDERRCMMARETR